MSSQYMRIIKILLVVLFTIFLIFGLWQANKIWRNYLNSDFTTEEYDEIISRGKAGKDGLLPTQSEFIKKDAEFKRRIALLPKQRQEIVERAIIKLLVSSQRKLENPNNIEVMERSGEISNRLIHCLSYEEASIYLYTKGKKESHLRKLAILKADKYFSFKIIKTPNMSKKDCIDYINEK